MENREQKVVPGIRMKLQGIGFSIFCIFCLATSAHAATVKLSSTVLFTTGPYVAQFTEGDVVNISYELDTTVADTIEAVDEGFFPGATLNVSFDFPDLGVNINFSSGDVQIFDNTPNPDDQVITYANVNQGSSLLGGEEIRSIEFDFIGLTSMLSSDAIPNSLPNDITSMFLLFEIGNIPGHQIAFSAEDIRVIPLPAAIWLFGTAVVVLVGFSRRRKAA